MFKRLFSRFFANTAEVDIADDKNRFNVIMQKMLSTRWYVTILTMLSFVGILLAILFCVINKVALVQEWKDILLFLLGAFIGSYNRVVDYWFNNSQRDDKILEKMDQENDSQEVLKRKLEQQAQVDGAKVAKPEAVLPDNV